MNAKTVPCRHVADMVKGPLHGYLGPHSKREVLIVGHNGQKASDILAAMSKSFLGAASMAAYAGMGAEEKTPETPKIPTPAAGDIVAGPAEPQGPFKGMQYGIAIPRKRILGGDVEGT